jgi:hypothetical protein
LKEEISFFEELIALYGELEVSPGDEFIFEI